jgi:hypothetical protein
MGQYHTIYNLTKKEMLIPHKMGDGTKLLEFSTGGLTTAALAVLLCNSNGRGGGDLSISGPQFEKRTELLIYIEAVQGRWSGDKIVIQGDYAKKGDPAFISEKKLEDFTDISSLCVKALMADDCLREETLNSSDYLVEKYTKQIAQSMESEVKTIDARIQHEKTKEKKRGAK